MHPDIPRIIETVSAWEGITAHPHRFGGTEFRLGSVEIGHVHHGGLVDIPFTRATRAALVAAGEAQLHHILPESGWISHYLRAPADTDRALRLYRLSLSAQAFPAEPRPRRRRADGGPGVRRQRDGHRLAGRSGSGRVGRRGGGRMTGYFIVIEGLDGSGKSAISGLLAEHFAARLGADNALHTYEPHNPSAAGAFIRDVLEKRVKVTTWALALAFALNRVDHNERIITPFLDGGDGRVVVCDRYIMSSLVYQSDGNPPTGSRAGFAYAAEGLNIDTVAALNAGARRPDLTLFLDASPETCTIRMGNRGGERELYEERLAESRDKYLRVIDWLRGQGSTIALIDANGAFEDVFSSVLYALQQHAPEWVTRA
ncbi:MAG: DUF5519 family protein [Chloroflexi bacterium]|nr:DUF5519 family protein [Chloroflexota bacterium]